MVAACGSEYDLSCPGTRECYYGNNLETYLSTCKQTAMHNAWLSIKAGTLTGVIAGAAGGLFFFGAGAVPGAVAGGVAGFVAGGLVAIHILTLADTECQNSLAELCATCQARCVE